MGPTEARVVISCYFGFGSFCEYFHHIFFGVGMFILFISNILETNRILKLADIQDKEEKIEMVEKLFTFTKAQLSASVGGY